MIGDRSLLPLPGATAPSAASESEEEACREDNRHVSLDAAATRISTHSTHTSSGSDTTPSSPRKSNRKVTSSAQIQPTPPLVSDDESSLKPAAPTIEQSRRKSYLSRLQSVRTPHLHESFYDAYGSLGIVELGAFLMSFVATACTAVVQIVPTWTANYILDTDKLDNGNFLLLSQPSLAMTVMSALALVIFACMYAWLIVFMLEYRSESMVAHLAQPPDTRSLLHRLVRRCLPLLKVTAKSRPVNSPQTDIPATDAVATDVLSGVTAGKSSLEQQRSLRAMPGKLRRVPSFNALLVNKLVLDFTDMDGAYHHYYDAILDFPKLIVQTQNLFKYLKKGFPLSLITFYAMALGFNWLISFYRFQRQKPDPALLVARVFYLFDLFFAVFAPMVVLVYSYYNFSMDREAFATRQETLTPGSFDRIARQFADPMEVELFRAAFANLLITDGYYLALKSFLNLLGIYKWKKVITYLILADRCRQTGVCANSPRQTRAHVIYGGVVFICCCMGIASYTLVAVFTSMQSCADVSQYCPVHAYQWQVGDPSCPCIVFIDRELAPRTFDEWIDAPDVTEAVRSVARPGYLKTVQIINRALPELPEELRLCTDFKDLILIYTQTQRFPEWTKEFTHLQYFHVESDFVNFKLQYLPPDLFLDMHDIRSIRAGGAAGITEFPSLKGLHKLKTLVMTIVRAMPELPELSDLSGLTTLYVADAIHVPRLPSLQPLKSLKNFAVFRRNEICCNGFVTGNCDLDNFQCQSREREREVQCVNERMPEEDLALVHRIDGFLCGMNITQDLDESEPTRESTDGSCQGVLYRECYVNGKRGICYNGRMQVVHCDVFGEYEQMRRLQIARQVGTACDPEEEAWLGCLSASSD